MTPSLMIGKYNSSANLFLGIELLVSWGLRKVKTGTHLHVQELWQLGQFFEPRSSLCPTCLVVMELSFRLQPWRVTWSNCETKTNKQLTAKQIKKGKKYNLLPNQQKAEKESNSKKEEAWLSQTPNKVIQIYPTRLTENVNQFNFPTKSHTL